MDNVHFITKHNNLYKQNLVSYKLKINQFADLLHHEFINKFFGFNNTHNLKHVKKGARYIPPANVELPAAVDWREQGAVTPVKNQGDCMSCYSFSATGSLEGQHFRSTKQLVSLSEQNILDCSQKFGNDGCQGGQMDFAFTYVKANNGIDTEDSYPYQAENLTCRYQSKTKGATDSGFVDIAEGSEEELQAATATVGPISIAIDASQDSFQFYSDGVYYEPTCSSDHLDHAVLVVGYDTDENGQEYWIVKNSWGENWGKAGYINMARNRDNNCGIASKASYPLV